MAHKHVHYTDVIREPVEDEGVVGVGVRWVIAAADGAKNFAMRIFDVAPGGHTPYHEHAWEHEVYILEGSGTLTVDGRQEPRAPAEVVFIPGGLMHNFSAGAEGLRFICLVPY
jgi:quercetin dioxygenase-like cupin family protein